MSTPTHLPETCSVSVPQNLLPPLLSPKRTRRAPGECPSTASTPTSLPRSREVKSHSGQRQVQWLVPGEGTRTNKLPKPPQRGSFPTDLQPELKRNGSFTVNRPEQARLCQDQGTDLPVGYSVKNEHLDLALLPQGLGPQSPAGKADSPLQRTASSSQF